MADKPTADDVAEHHQEQSSDRDQADANQTATMGAFHDAEESKAANQVVNAASLATLLANADRTAAAAKQSAEDLIDTLALQQERADTARRRFYITLAVLAFVVLVSAAGSVAFFWKINDCTSPQGACYREARTQTGGAVTSINQVTVLAAVCAPDYAALPRPQREVGIQACIEAGLAGK